MDEKLVQDAMKLRRFRKTKVQALYKVGQVKLEGKGSSGHHALKTIHQRLSDFVIPPEAALCLDGLRYLVNSSIID